MKVRKMRRSTMGILGVALTLLSACAHKTPPQPPILSLATERACASTPDTTRAEPLTLSSEKDAPVTVAIGQDSACLQSGDVKSLYGVVALPATGEEYVVSVASEPLGESIFAPRLLLLDDKGAVQREIRRDAFMFRGGALTALIRVRGSDRYLVIASDPDGVGKNVSRVQGATQANVVSNGMMGFVVNTGSETKTNLTYSHGGSVKVMARTLIARR